MKEQTDAELLRIFIGEGLVTLEKVRVIKYR